MNSNISTTPGNFNLKQNIDSGFAKKTSNSIVLGIKGVTSSIINSREDLAEFLLKKDIQLLTSLTEFLDTGSFIKSSYVAYIKHDNKQESFGDFLVRYPEFEKIAYLIEDYNKS